MRIVKVLKVGDVWHLAFSPDGQRLAVSSSRGNSRLVSMSGGPTIMLRSSGVGMPVCFASDGQAVLGPTGQSSAVVSSWDLDGVSVPQSLTGPPGSSFNSFSPDGSRILWAFRDEGRELWLECQTIADQRSPWRIRSAGGRLLFALDAKRAILVSRFHIDVIDEPGELQRRIPFPEGDDFLHGRGFAISPDGRLAALTRPTSITVHDLDTGATVTRWEESLGLSSGPMAFSPDGQTLYRLVRSRVQSWLVEGWQPQPIVDPEIGLLHAIAVSGDGMLGAVGGSDGRVAIWDVG